MSKCLTFSYRTPLSASHRLHSVSYCGVLLVCMRGTMMSVKPIAVQEVLQKQLGNMGVPKAPLSVPDDSTAETMFKSILQDELEQLQHDTALLLNKLSAALSPKLSDTCTRSPPPQSPPSSPSQEQDDSHSGASIFNIAISPTAHESVQGGRTNGNKFPNDSSALLDAILNSAPTSSQYSPRASGPWGSKVRMKFSQ